MPSWSLEERNWTLPSSARRAVHKRLTMIGHGLDLVKAVLAHEEGLVALKHGGSAGSREILELQRPLDGVGAALRFRANAHKHGVVVADRDVALR